MTPSPGSEFPDPRQPGRRRAVPLDGLDPEQLEAATAPRGPVCILAGAGTGKTRTITHRIAHLVDADHVRPGQVLAVTFTSRAAGELRSRLAAMGVDRAGGGRVQARTFHAAAMRQLAYFWPQVVGDTPWRLLDRKFAVVARAASRVGADTTTESIRDLLAEIEWAKATQIVPADYPARLAASRRTGPAEPRIVADVYACYEDLKRTADGFLLDFDDLLIYTAAALEENPAVAEEFRERYRCFVVDEYQDVTPLQQRVLDAWLGGRDDLTVVGDANQTIYSFTGATPSYLLDFTARFPDATLVRLNRDYRSTPQVVGLANAVIGRARGRVAGTRLELVGMRPPGPDPVFASYPDEPAEAEGVARAIRALIAAGRDPAEIAILYRINAQSEVFEHALAEQGIAYQVRGGEGFFQREEIRRAMSEIRRLAVRDDLPEDAVGPGLVTLVRAALVPLGLGDAEPTGAQARERYQSLRALVDLTVDLTDATPGLDVAGLDAELRSRAADRHPPTVRGVTLASLHAAKGLEWDAVFLVGLTDGGVPIQHVLRDGGDEEGIEEERRLLYVGVTRAREDLHLSWSAARKPGGRGTRRRTRFLDGLVPGEPDEPAEGHAPSPRRRRRGVCRVCGKPLAGPLATKLGRCEDCPSDIDEDLFELLRAWRLGRAQELSVPAFVVFTDATLTAIAEARPSDPAGLMRIPGIGAAKMERFGEDVLAIIRDHGAGGQG